MEIIFVNNILNKPWYKKTLKISKARKNKIFSFLLIQHIFCLSCQFNALGIEISPTQNKKENISEKNFLIKKRKRGKTFKVTREQSGYDLGWKPEEMQPPPKVHEFPQWRGMKDYPLSVFGSMLCNIGYWQWSGMIGIGLKIKINY